MYFQPLSKVPYETDFIIIGDIRAKNPLGVFLDNELVGIIEVKIENYIGNVSLLMFKNNPLGARILKRVLDYYPIVLEINVPRAFSDILSGWGNCRKKDNRAEIYSSIKLPEVSKGFVRQSPYNAASLAIMAAKDFVRQKNPRNITHIVLSKNEVDEKLPAVRCFNWAQVFEYIKAAKSETPIYYVTCGYSGMRKFCFHKKMRGNVLIPKHGNLDISLIRVDYGGRNYNVCRMKNAIDGINDLVFKDNLAKLVPQYMPKTIDVLNIDHDASFPCIIKPVSKKAFSGLDIFVVNNMSELKSCLAQLRPKWDRVTVQEYLVDPILFMGKKCHLRVHILITSWKRIFIKPSYKILTSKLPYVNDDWGNKDIHDSHAGSTEAYFYYPRDKEFLGTNDDTIGQLPDSLKEMFDTIIERVNPTCFDECSFAYEVLGADIMLTSSGPKLLEINDGLALDWKYKQVFDEGILKNDVHLLNQERSFYEKEFLEWEYECIRDHLH